MRETIEAFAKRTNDKAMIAALEADLEEAEYQLGEFETVLENIGKEHQIGQSEKQSDINGTSENVNYSRTLQNKKVAKDS